MTTMTSPPPDVQPGRWTVVLPVKGGPDAKSRLAHPARDGLAGAVALDTVAAVLRCPQVARTLVVTGDPAAAAQHRALGAEVVADPGGGLARALAAGVLAASSGGAVPCALLLADLPALRPEDLEVALVACLRALRDGADQVTVPDADGTGTVLLAAASPAALRPSFGPGSADAHGADALVLAGAPVRLRRDVDTAAHLSEAVRLGVGPRTAAVLAGPGAAGAAG
jgi:2-phospho-L-lactate guanylyltransferase